MNDERGGWAGAGRRDECTRRIHTFMASMCEYGVTPVAISSAVMPKDQMSAFSLYPRWQSDTVHLKRNLLHHLWGHPERVADECLALLWVNGGGGHQALSEETLSLVQSTLVSGRSPGGCKNDDK